MKRDIRKILIFISAFFSLCAQAGLLQAASGTTIDSLLRHFRAAGLAATEQGPSYPQGMEDALERSRQRELQDSRYAQARQATREAMRKRGQDMAISRPGAHASSRKEPVETANLCVDSVNLIAQRYYDASSARDAYERMVKAQSWLEEKEEKGRRSCLHVTYFLNGAFVLKILHYEVREAYAGGPLEKREIYIDPASLSRIEKAFKSFRL